MPGLVGHFHLDQHITREEATLGHRFSAILDLDHFFGRDQDLAELLLHAAALDAFGQAALHALFHARIGMNHVPALVRFAAGYPPEHPAGTSPAYCQRFRSSLFPSQDHIVHQEFKNLIRAPQENRHHQHEAEDHHRDLGSFLARGPDDLFSFADCLLGKAQEVATGSGSPQQPDRNDPKPAKSAPRTSDWFVLALQDEEANHACNRNNHCQHNLELVVRGADGLHGLIRHTYFTFGCLAPNSVAGEEGIEPATFGFGDRRSAN